MILVSPPVGARLLQYSDDTAQSVVRVGSRHLRLVCRRMTELHHLTWSLAARSRDQPPGLPIGALLAVVRHGPTTPSHLSQPDSSSHADIQSTPAIYEADPIPELSNASWPDAVALTDADRERLRKFHEALAADREQLCVRCNESWFFTYYLR
jgi:hypothetical protein